jgi:plastocyanin domain-containing protein
MNKYAAIAIGSILFIGIGYILTLDSQSTSTSQPSLNSEIKDGIQYISINAHRGYSPRISTAKGGLPTKLIVKTDGTYDCSASLAIRSIGYQKILPDTGETEIDLGMAKSGETLQGVCSMGMYSFQVKFS